MRPTEAGARRSLTAHAADLGAAIRATYGTLVGWNDLQEILKDRSAVRYPCELVFDDGPLQPGELAHPVPRSDRPEDGFTLHVHPYFATRLADVPAVALYQLVLVNYGEFASTEDAETFGAVVLGISRDEYYRRLCELADELTFCEAAGGSCGFDRADFSLAGPVSDSSPHADQE